MKKSKPIEAGNWVFWFGGLFKVVEVKNEHVPKQFMQGALAVRPHGFDVAVLEPIRVSEHVLRWYREDELYHGGVILHYLKRINPLSAQKRGFLK